MGSAKLSVERESQKNTLSEDVSDVEEKSEKETREMEEERRGLDLQRVLEDTRNFVRDDFSILSVWRAQSISIICIISPTTSERT